MDDRGCEAVSPGIRRYRGLGEELRFSLLIDGVKQTSILVRACRFHVLVCVCLYKVYLADRSCMVQYIATYFGPTTTAFPWLSEQTL